MKNLTLLFALILLAISSQAQLIINELSQGASGTKEYVELLVTGTPVCGGTNTVDLRGWIIDDNNSWHASGSGSGIAGGHVRFDSIAQWENVKIGSLIVIYNDADVSPAITALGVDIDDSNHDCVYVVPVSSSVLQKNTTLPGNNGTMSTYASAGIVYSPTGTWTCLGMANAADAFHTVSPANYSAPYFAIGWGNNSNLVNVYYSGSQGGKVIYMANTVNNDPFNANNFVDTAAAMETPGVPNNAANAAWITGLNNGCQPFVLPTLTLNTPAALSCGTTSTVIIASSTTSGAVFNWSNGVTGTNDTVGSGGKYYVTVSDAGGVCSNNDSVTVASSSTLSISTAVVGTACGNSDGVASVAVSVGTASGYIWSTGSTNDTITGLAAGTYTVTVNGSGGCSATASVIITQSAPANVTITADQTTFCSSDSAHVCAPGGYTSYIWNTGATTDCIYTRLAGNYYVTVTDAGNCTATSNHLAINVYPLPPVSISVNGDTLNAYGSATYQWKLNDTIIAGATSGTYIATHPGYYSVLVTDSNGCTALSNPVIITISGINDVLVSEDLTIYPNPSTSGNWIIETSGKLEEGKLELFDNNGRLVYKTQIVDHRSHIDTELAKGVYLLKIISGRNIITRKLVHL